MSSDPEQNTPGAPPFGAPSGAPVPDPSPASIAPRELIALENIFVSRAGLRAGWRAGLYVALFILFLTIAQVAATLLHLSLVARNAAQLTPARLLAQELMLALSALGAALVMTRIEGRSFADYGLPWRGAFGRSFWRGVLWGTAQISSLILLIWVFGGYSLGMLTIHGRTLVYYAVVWAAFFLVVGLAEEFLFRGYLQFTLASGMGFWPAATLMSLIFGAVHLQNPGESLWGAVGVFGVGMLLSLTLRRTGTLWFAIGFHAAFDFGETYIYSVPDSGITMPGQLFSASLRGPRWLTGGKVGPEGSVLAFLLLALFFVLFERMYPAQPDPAKTPADCVSPVRTPAESE